MSKQARREGGCDGCARTPPPPQTAEVHFFVKKINSKKIIIVLICLPRCTQGGLSLAHFWKIVMISSQPSEQYGFTTLFLFLLFLNSDIGIVILYIVKYIRKAFSLPKKSILKFKIWQISTFLGSLLATYIAIILTFKTHENAVSDNLIFKISRGGMPPDPPSKERLRRSLVGIINWSHPPVKKSWLRAWSKYNWKKFTP